MKKLRDFLVSLGCVQFRDETRRKTRDSKNSYRAWFCTVKMSTSFKGGTFDFRGGGGGDFGRKQEKNHAH